MRGAGDEWTVTAASSDRSMSCAGAACCVDGVLNDDDSVVISVDVDLVADGVASPCGSLRLITTGIYDSRENLADLDLDQWDFNDDEDDLDDQQENADVEDEQSEELQRKAPERMAQERRGQGRETLGELSLYPFVLQCA